MWKTNQPLGFETYRSLVIFKRVGATVFLGGGRCLESHRIREFRIVYVDNSIYEFCYQIKDRNKATDGGNVTSREIFVVVLLVLLVGFVLVRNK